MNGFVWKQVNTSSTYRPHKYSFSIARLLTALAVSLCLQPAFADGVPLRPGEVFVTTFTGAGSTWGHHVKHFSPNGVLLDNFNFGTNNAYFGSLSVDASNNLYIPTDGTYDEAIHTISNSGVMGLFGGGYAFPTSVAFDNNGNVYVGQNPSSNNSPGAILKFDGNGNLLTSYSIPVDPSTGDAIDHMALANDHCTMRYTTGGDSIHQFNIYTNTQLSDFVSSLSDPFGGTEVLYDVRQLPNDNLLVASWDYVFLLSSSGSVLNQYEFNDGPYYASLGSVYPDPDNHTLWMADSNSGNVFRVNMQTGAIVSSFSAYDPGHTSTTAESIGYLAVVPGNPNGKELGKSCNCIGDPINSATGNEYKDDEDISLGALSFHRYYNSQTSVAPAHMGTNWRHTFDRSIEYVPSIGLTVATAFRPDGRELNFTLTSGQWVADPDVADRLTPQTDTSGALTGWTYFDSTTRYQESYDKNGNLLSITDTDGLVTTLAYSTSSTPSSVAPAAGLLLTVTDPRGRALNFTYNSNATVAAISEPDGGSVTYGYDGNRNLTSVTYPDKSSRQYVYNESTLTSSANLPAALTGDIDETSTRFTSISYNAQGKATMSMLASNIAETQVAYNTDGTSTVTYPTGSQSTLTFNQQFGSFQRTTASAPCGVQCDQPYASSTYDANGYLASATDFNSNVTTTTYDTNGLLDQQVEASGTRNQRTTNFTWNTTLRVPLTRAVVDASGNTVGSTQWIYNGIGQVLARCDIDPGNSAAPRYACSTSGSVPSGVRRSTYTYCTVVDTTQCPFVGLTLTITGPRTDVTQTTTYTYYLTSSATNCGTPGAACYQVGDIHTITDAAGHVTTIASYDADGRVTRITDANGVNTDMSYTARGWLASSIVGGAATSFTYTPYGAVQTVTDPDGIVTTYGYDAAHRLVKITDAQGNYVQYTLDAAGNKTAEKTYDSSGALHKSLSRNFNALGQLTKVMDGLNHTVFDASASGNYDANGNLVQDADGLGILRKQSYDALNRLVQTIDNYNGNDGATKNTTIQYGYDSLDRLTQVTDPGNLNTTYSYDGLSDTTGQVSPDTGTTSRTFDAAGNVLTSTDAKGITAINTYDVLNRLISTNYPDGTQNVTYAYDEANSVTGCSSSYPVGRLTRIIENSVTTVYCYDARGNVVEKQQTINGTTDTTGYAVSAAGRVTSIVYPSGTQVSYTRDADGRIQSVSVLPSGSTTATTVVSNVTYQPFGPVSGYTLGNGQAVARAYDANYRLTDITSAAFSLHLARDAMGDVTAIGNTSGANPATETYSYDPLYRLTAVTEADGSTLESVTYNQTGDRLIKAASGLDTGSYAYNSGTHQLTAIGNQARTVDANGNTTAITQASGTYGFGYSSRNVLTVAQFAGATVGTYTYNALSQRISKTGSGTVRYGYDEAKHLVGEYGASTRDYVWMGDIPVATVDVSATSNPTSTSSCTSFSSCPIHGGPIKAPSPGTGTSSLSGTMTTTVNYVYADGLGTPRAVASSTGTVIWQWAYQGNPWGEVAPMSVGGYVLNLRFPGQYYDQETGLIYNVNRYYEAPAGRYLQSDPAGLQGGINTYNYVNGSPLDYVDPLGLRPPTSGEISMLNQVFNNTVDFSKVNIVSGAGLDPRAWAPIATDNAVTLENTIHFPSSGYQSDFSKANLTDQAWLAHEMTHVYQYQNNPNYSWRKAAMEGTRSDTYKYSLSEHGCFNDYRYEQQAAIVADYYAALQRPWSPALPDYESLLNQVGLGMNRGAPPIWFIGDR